MVTNLKIQCIFCKIIRRVTSTTGHKFERSHARRVTSQKDHNSEYAISIFEGYWKGHKSKVDKLKAHKSEVSLVRWLTHLTEQQPMDINRGRMCKGHKSEAFLFFLLLE